MVKVLGGGRAQPLIDIVDVIDTTIVEGITATVVPLLEVCATVVPLLEVVATVECINEDVGNFAIDTFAAGVNPVEVGASVVTPAFTAAYTDGPPVEALLDDDEGSPQKDVSGTPTAFSSDGTFQKLLNNEDVEFTLSAKKFAPLTPLVANATLQWQPRLYNGAGVDGLGSEADIEGLSNSYLDNNRQGSFTVNAGVGEHIYFALPTSYGTPTFFILGFETSFTLEATGVSVTNVNGVTQTYELWKSNFDNLGNTTVTVT